MDVLTWEMKIIYDSGNKVAFENMTIISFMLSILYINGISVPKGRIILKAAPFFETYQVQVYGKLSWYSKIMIQLKLVKVVDQ